MCVLVSVNANSLDFGKTAKEGAFRMRLVTHLDVGRKDIEEAAQALTNIVTHA
jgi:hypothetical protein